MHNGACVFEYANGLTLVSIYMQQRFSGVQLHSRLSVSAGGQFAFS